MLKQYIKTLTSSFDEAIIRPDDPDDVRLGKRIFVRLNLLVVLVSLIFMIQGVLVAEPAITIFSLLVVLLFSGNLVLVKRSGHFRPHFTIFVLMNMLIPFVWSAIFGGFNDNYGHLWLSFDVLLLVILVSGQREIIAWFVGFSVLTILSVILDPYVANPANLSPTLLFDNLFSILLAASIILLIINYYKREKNSALQLLTLEQEKSEALLLNILPPKIADILKKKEPVIADRYESASILFADLSGFTPMSAQMEPEEMVILLNDIYSHFDTLAEKYGVEKIRTMGDSYMVASGVPTQRDDHASALAHMALDMLEFSNNLPSQNGESINFRIGMNSGSLVAGVIGKKKFHYDVWGDTVNTASRMESHGVPGKIQVTKDSYDLLKNEFVFESRGKMDVKGKGEMETWFLVGRKE